MTRTHGFALASALRLFRVIACACAALLFGVNVAWAQSVAPPPIRTAVDSNGVDLITGALYVAMPSISVGQPGAGGLAYGPTFDSSVQAWRDGFSGTINLDSATGIYTVTLFGASKAFTLAAGVYSAVEPDGSTLSFSANTYTYITRNGAEAVYEKGLAGTSPTQANEGRITSFTLPTGERQTFTYVALNSTTQRLQSVNNNLGYQIKFEYQNNDPATGGLTLVKATAINNAIDYCDPAANGCTSLSQTWPSLTFSATMTTATDALGRVTGYTYTNGRITGMRPPSSATNIVTIAYDTSNRVASVSNGTGTWTYAYTDNGAQRTTTITDPLSHVRTVGSSTTLRVITFDINALGRTTSYLYDPAQRLQRITQPEGNYTEFTYDTRGNVLTAIQAPKPGSGLVNITTSAAYPASCPSLVTCDLPTSTTDARGFSTDFTYDPVHGGVLTATAPDPDGAGPLVRPQTRFIYTSLYAFYKTSSGAPAQAPTPVFQLTEISACATSASCANLPDETRTVIDYGASGVANNRLPVSVTTRSGDNLLSTTTTLGYDNVRNVLSVDGPLANDASSNVYDIMRQQVGAIGPDPDGAGTLKNRAQRITYNPDGQPTMVENGTVNSQLAADWAGFAPLERASFVYDTLGRRTRANLIDVNSPTTPIAVSQFSYDNANRLECAAQRMNPATFASLPASACTLATQGSNGPDRIVRNTYNNADQVTQVTSGYATAAPINESTTTYTNNGLPATVLGAPSIAGGSGNLTTFVYDGFDRLITTRYPDAVTGAVSSTSDVETINAYNAASQPTSVTLRGGQTIAFAYDNLGRRTSSDAPGGTPGDALDINQSYDNFSRPLTVALTNQSGSTLTFGYDQLSRLTSAAGPQGTVAYQYDAAGQRTRMTWPDAFFITYEYDNAGAVSVIREQPSAQALATFAYDNLGRRTSLVRGNGVATTYVYDPVSRLSTLTQNLGGAATSQDQSTSFTYSPASQIAARTGTNAAYDTPAPSNGTTNYVRNGLNQYFAGGAFSYDGRGNLTSTQSTAYGYDSFNRLTSAGTANLAYDAAGRLRETSVGGASVTRFLYDGADMIGEYNASNALLRRYVFGPGVDEPLVWYEGTGTGDRRYLVADERGSIVAVTNSAGAASGTGFGIHSYDEYGAPGPSNNSRFQYTGQAWLPEAGLYHYKARAYSPSLGRFLQTDPIGFGGGMNLYAYVGNDPVNWTDPSGLVTCTGSRIGRSDCASIAGFAREVGTRRGGGGRGGGGQSGGSGGVGADGVDTIIVTGTRPGGVNFNDLGTLPGVTLITDNGGGGFHDGNYTAGTPDLDPEHEDFCEGSRNRLDEIALILPGLDQQTRIIEQARIGTNAIVALDLAAMTPRDSGTANNPWVRGFRGAVRAVRNFLGLGVTTSGRRLRGGSVAVALGASNGFSHSAQGIFGDAAANLRSEAAFLNGARAARGC